MRECVHCGIDISFKRKYAIYCSKSCKNSKWFINNKSHKDEYDRQRRLKNPDIFVKYSKDFRIKNPKKRYEYDKKTLSKSFKHRFYKNCLTQIKKSFKNKCKSKYFVYLGTDYKTLREHLVKTLPIGFTWSDYLNGILHLDHIKPHSLFNYESIHDVDFKNCWSLKNLRLLQKEINIKKSNKYEN